MRPGIVVISPPIVDPDACVIHGQELRCVQTFLSKTAVEGLHVGIVCWFSWPGEVQFDFVQISPLIEKSTSKLWAVVNPNAPRLTSNARQPVQLVYDLIGTEFRPRSGHESLSRKTVHDGQNSEWFFVKQPVRHEVHRPDIVHAVRFGSAGAIPAGTPPLRIAGAD